MKTKTTISITVETKRKLEALSRGKETWDELLNRMIEAFEWKEKEVTSCK
jgi:predicted CopG family antitoxin